VVYKQGTKISKTIFGFMGLGGKDVVMVWYLIKHRYDKVY
jgi:hypothetical protein